MGFDATTTYAGITIRVLHTNPQRIQAPYIQKMGKTIVKTAVPTDTMAWRLILRCKFVGSAANLDTWKTSIEAANEDKLAHDFVDGVHDGSYICEDLVPDLDPSKGALVTNLPFTLTLIEKKFSGGF